MGVHPNISATRFPRQSEDVNSRVDVCFHYDTSARVPGRIVRDDLEQPFVTVIALDDGPVVLATECQYSILD
jgi:hypothetical protein